MTTSQGNSHRNVRSDGRAVLLNLRTRFDEQGEEMLWLASWIVGLDGTEGDWFYSGTGCNADEYAAPGDAIGVRIRRWPSRGMDPEFVDLDMGSDGLSIIDRGLAFDRPQSRNVLTAQSV